jgi:hypothetical protein
MIQKKIVQRSCRGPISVKRIDSKGDYIVIENTCIKKVIAKIQFQVYLFN